MVRPKGSIRKRGAESVCVGVELGVWSMYYESIGPIVKWYYTSMAWMGSGFDSP